MPPITRIACIGEVMIELIAGHGNAAELNVAGDTYNTAVYLKRHARGLDVDYVTALGRDTFSDRILAHMTAHDVGTKAVARHPTRMPGLYAIETDALGERSFSYWRETSAARTLFDSDGAEGVPRNAAEVLAHYDLVLLTGITLAILSCNARNRLMTAIDAYRAGGGQIAFDSNYRPHLWNDPALARRETEAMWQRTDIALPSVDDEIALFGDADEAAVLARLADCGIKAGALKCAEAGPVNLGSDSTRAKVSPATQVVDTTAAGDSFNAGYIAALALGATPTDAMIAGHTLALQVIAKRGGIVDTD
ncbi:sugar kinase [Rhodobacteraceae bacterium]|nr:sugar kinase [Paracoccaceae bacterium]